MRHDIDARADRLYYRRHHWPADRGTLFWAWAKLDIAFRDLERDVLAAVGPLLATLTRRRP